MGLFESLRRLLPIRVSSNPKSRWQFLDDGMCIDTLRDSELAWRVGANRFESLLQSVEKRTENSLGRRLAHAALEHEERFIGLGEITRPSGRNPSSWSEYISDWESRGLGRFRLLDDEQDIRILAEGPASGPICAGVIAAAWECSTGRRHRFTWSDGASDGLVVSLIKQHSDVPGPKPMSVPWISSGTTHLPGLRGILGDLDYWVDYRSDGGGTWSIMGERRVMIHLDLITRFEDYCIPYIEGNRFLRSEDYEWDGLDDKRSTWWDATADSARDGFVSEGHHILVRDDSDWISIARRHLSSHGLGGLSRAEKIDDHGGILLTFSEVFHPAISSGILLGCWERAYGRNGRAKLSFKSGKSTLELRSSRAIAD